MTNSDHAREVYGIRRRKRLEFVGGLRRVEERRRIAARLVADAPVVDAPDEIATLPKILGHERHKLRRRQRGKPAAAMHQQHHRKRTFA